MAIKHQKLSNAIIEILTMMMLMKAKQLFKLPWRCKMNMMGRKKIQLY